ncbi:hypothetical protein GALMADRAFT_1126027 [Galerina marginata CBS 339.88]|uniref:G-protein coupled receptors family 1 profile domain-containing protein n=1 Tax=Galerina marginata (strain CBS 339.88) TaxID=685588 RepID=A0A067S8R4_GALM3|nr:hypothetical protein GALMADRAFT_1126027 [Galerina marginata CBS 339.88]
MRNLDNWAFFWPFLGTLASTMAYVIVISLYYNCFLLLSKGVPVSSPRTRRFLLTYISLLLVLSTWSLVQQLYVIITSLFYLDSSDTVILSGSWLTEFPPFLVLTIWAADSFMIWRCFVLFHNTSTGYRIMAMVLLLLISLASLGAGLFLFISNLFVYSGFLSASISTTANIMLSIMIASRLLRHQKYLRRVLGVGHGSAYTRIITMCVESCALIVFFMAAYTIMFNIGCNAQYIPFFLLPHICVISALMIVSRVAQGTESTATIPPPSSVVHRPESVHVEENIRFVGPFTTEIGRESV